MKEKKSLKSNADSTFRFQKHDNVGSNAAEEDEAFLTECFADVGDIKVLESSGSPKCLVIGRTGAGKTALLRRLLSNNRNSAIEISPDSLALTHVSNSNVIGFYSSVGVNLDPFFKLLWRHVIAVEIIKNHEKITSHSAGTTWVAKLKSTFVRNTKEDRKKQLALDYLSKWGDGFWLETEERVKEVTSIFEDRLSLEGKASLKSYGISGEIGSSTAARLTEEQKTEFLTRGQRVVSEAQAQDLTNLITLLQSLLTDPQQNYYIVIDKLDENWVEEKLRMRLIRALIETCRELRAVGNLKVIIAIRKDLLARVFRLTRDPGFQSEKYDSLCLRLVWTPGDLLNLLNLRIQKLVSRQYTGKPVKYTDLLPGEIDKIDIGTFITDRASRPRDIIDFFNRCIQVAVDKRKLNIKELKEAEGEYSKSRLRAVFDEWRADYPNLEQLVRLIYRKPPSFKLSSISKSEIEDFCLNEAANHSERSDIINVEAKALVNEIKTVTDFRKVLCHSLFTTGIVGIKLEKHETAVWSDERAKSISTAEISDQCSILVHPTFHRVLGIQH